MRPLHGLEPGRAAEAGALVQVSIEGVEPVLSTCSDARASTSSCCRCSVRRTLDETNFQSTREYQIATAAQNGERSEFRQAEIKSAIGSARFRS